MSTETVRTTEGFQNSLTPSGTANPTAVASPALTTIPGQPAKAVLNAVAAALGPLILELPDANLYRGKQVLLDLTADVGNGISFAARTGNTIANNPGPQTSISPFIILSDGSEWTFVGGISL